MVACQNIKLDLHLEVKMSVIHFKSAYYSEFMIFFFSSRRRLYLHLSCNNVFAFVSHL